MRRPLLLAQLGLDYAYVIYGGKAGDRTTLRLPKIFMDGSGLDFRNDTLVASVGTATTGFTLPSWEFRGSLISQRMLLAGVGIGWRNSLPVIEKLFGP
jgi:hypothetical protein